MHPATYSAGSDESPVKFSDAEHPICPACRQTITRVLLEEGLMFARCERQAHGGGKCGQHMLVIAEDGECATSPMSEAEIKIALRLQRHRAEVLAQLRERVRGAPRHVPAREVDCSGPLFAGWRLRAWMDLNMAADAAGVVRMTEREMAVRWETSKGSVGRWLADLQRDGKLTVRRVGSGSRGGRHIVLAQPDGGANDGAEIHSIHADIGGVRGAKFGAKAAA